MKHMILALLVTVPILWGCGSGGGAAQAQTLNEISFPQFTNFGVDGAQSIACPAKSIPVSAGCFCPIPETDGIFSVRIDGNGAICGCTPTLLNGEASIGGPLEVSVICATQSNDKASSNSTISKPGIKSDALLDEEGRLREMIYEKMATLE